MRFRMDRRIFRVIKYVVC